MRLRTSTLMLVATACSLVSCDPDPLPETGPEPGSATASRLADETPPPTPVPAPAQTEGTSKSAPAADPDFYVADEVDTTIGGAGDGPYRFTAPWHKAVMKNWERHLAEFAGKPDLRYLEIGVYEGRSLLWMYRKVLTHPGSKATAIDVFAGDYEQTFDANLIAGDVAERTTKIKGPSQRELKRLEPDSFDIIYIDGSHTADDVLADAVLAWDLLREGGIIIFDDYTWTGRRDKGKLPVELLPVVAIDAFITSYRNTIEIIDRGDQVILRKRANPCEEKYYCSPIAQYNYHWREFELRERKTNEVVELSEQERKLVEVIAHSKRIGDVDYTFDPRFRDSPEFQALVKKLSLPF